MQEQINNSEGLGEQWLPLVTRCSKKRILCGSELQTTGLRNMGKTEEIANSQVD